MVNIREDIRESIAKLTLMDDIFHEQGLRK